MCKNCAGGGQICRRCGRSIMEVYSDCTVPCNGGGPHDYVECPECDGEGTK